MFEMVWVLLILDWTQRTRLVPSPYGTCLITKGDRRCWDNTHYRQETSSSTMSVIQH